MQKQVSLNVKCPLCRKSLMATDEPLNNRPSIKVNIQVGEQRGTLKLCSIYGCTDHQSSFEIPQNEVVDFYCPHCNQQLVQEVKCQECDAPTIPFLLDIGGKVAICSRYGCDKRYIVFEDLTDALRKFHREYGI